MLKPLKSFALGWLCLLTVIGSARADAVAPPLVVKDWATTRMRKTMDASNVVQAEFKLVNQGADAISDITLVISYQTAEGRELKASDPVRVARLAAGETKGLTVQTGWAPTFESYEIRIAYRTPQGPRRARWCGSGTDGQPFFIPEEPVPGEPRIVILGDALWLDKQNAPLQGVIRIRNLGATAVEKLAAKIVFTDGQPNNPRTLGTWSGAIGDGALAGGEEKVVRLSINQAPKFYGGYRIEFTYLASEKASEFSKWCGGEFTNIRAVETAHWQMQRPAAQPGDLAVGFSIRNGLPETVESVTVSIAFLKKEGATMRVVRQVYVQLLEELPPGRQQRAEVVLKNFKTLFDDIERTFVYQVKDAKDGGR